MYKAATLPNESVTAFDCFRSHSNSIISSEQISLISNFIEAFVLYDEVYISPEKKNASFLSRLDPEKTIFKFEGMDCFNNQDDQDKLFYDVRSLDYVLPKLAEENKAWFMQRSPAYNGGNLDAEDDVLKHSSKDTSIIRLMQWCNLNENSLRFKTVPLLSLSLTDVEKNTYENDKASDVVLYRYLEFAKKHKGDFISIKQFNTDPFVGELTYTPPFMSLFVDRVKILEKSEEVLLQIRSEFSAFREVRRSYSRSILNAVTFGEKKEVVNEWNTQWEILCSGEFKKPSLLTRSFSTTDSVSNLVSVKSLTTSPSKLKDKLLEHNEYRKAHKKFCVFSDLKESLDLVQMHKNNLHGVFGIRKVVEYQDKASE